MLDCARKQAGLTKNNGLDSSIVLFIEESSDGPKNILFLHNISENDCNQAFY